MPRKALTAEQKATVERLAGLSFKYTRICEDQSIVLRQNVTLYYETYNRLNATAPPSGWQPPLQERAECIRQAEITCEMTPQNFEEYVSTTYVSCIVYLTPFQSSQDYFTAFFLQGSARDDIALVPQHVQYAIDVRITELR